MGHRSGSDDSGPTNVKTLQPLEGFQSADHFLLAVTSEADTVTVMQHRTQSSADTRAISVIEDSAFSALQFDNRFVRELPADPSREQRPRQVLGACYSRVTTTPVPSPRLIAHSAEVAEMIGLSGDAHLSSSFAEIMGGNALAKGMTSYAACYGGHQFGNWAGQLGDGRAICLGEVLRPDGQRWELQLKGAGPTPYSRTADGRAVMRSSVREFLCSEAMHHLGVPTTRALSLVGTGDRVVRDMFYDGRAAEEPGAVVCRVAPSFLRFGNYQLLAFRRDVDTLKKLVDHTITAHFPDLGPPNRECYVRFLGAVAERTAKLLVHWQRVGFVHGVMNTDNMSVLGLTIDYGPYGWLEDYDPTWTPNTTDANGRRYCFGNQPGVAFWNLVRFAEGLLPLIGDARPLEEALLAFPHTFDREQSDMMRRKLGLSTWRFEEDAELEKELFTALQLVETDMTIFFRTLANLSQQESDLGKWLDQTMASAYYRPDDLQGPHRVTILKWLARYQQRVRQQNLSDEARQLQMNLANPRYVLRNYLAQLAIDRAEQGDGALLYKLLDVLRHPYDEQPEHSEYAEKRPEWARHRPGCSMLSCSS